MRGFHHVAVFLACISLAGCQFTGPTSQGSTPIPSTAIVEPTPRRDYGSMSSPEFFDLPWEDRSPFYLGLIPNEQSILDELPGASSYRIDLQISDDLLSLSGYERVSYTNQEEDPLTEVIFRLYPNLFSGKLTIDALLVDGEIQQPQLEYLESALVVPFEDSLQPGDEVIIDLDFTLEIPTTPSGNYGLFGYIDGFLVLHEFFPIIPVYDDEGWNVEIPPPYGDVSYFDAAFFLVRVSAPASLAVVASGMAVDQIGIGDRQVVTFAAGPAREFYMAASEQFGLIEIVKDDTTIRSYYGPGMGQAGEAALTFASAALDSFNNRFGPYPYTELDIISTPIRALGMEYPGLIAIASTLYEPQATAAGSSASSLLETIVAHEVAHQWFFNVVGNDQVDEPWLDEAMAQYATWLYYVDRYGIQNVQWYRDSWVSRWQRVDGANLPIGLPTAGYDSREYSAIVYGRGPLFIEALAESMGEETFSRFLKNYYQTYQWGISTGPAFQELAEQHCECDLSKLFKEWVYPK